MTYYSHMKTLKISYFKAHLSQQLREVRNGERIIIMDRDKPVAEVVPIDSERKLTLRHPSRKLAYKKRAFTIDVDPLDVLLEDRGKR